MFSYGTGHLIAAVGEVGRYHKKRRLRLSPQDFRRLGTSRADLCTGAEVGRSLHRRANPHKTRLDQNQVPTNA